MEMQEIAKANLLEFFMERVREALQNQKLQAPAGVEFYLVNLLKDCIKSEELHKKPLALMMGDALEADFHRRIRILKQIGDLSLFTVGFFPDSIKRQLVDIDYYVQMGGTAYGNLSQIMSREPAFGEIFTELSTRFIHYVDVLSEVSEKSDLLTDRDLLQIYETWLKTGSERAKQRLSEEGILPIPEISRKSQ